MELKSEIEILMEKNELLEIEKKNLTEKLDFNENFKSNQCVELFHHLEVVF